MADSIVRDFLIDCQTVTEAEVHSFASSIRENNELIDSIIQVLEDKKYHKEFLEPLCEQLFAFFRAEEDPLRQFAMCFIPCIVGAYFGTLHKGDRKTLRCIETLLLGAYNLQVLDSEGKPNVSTSIIPSISKPSIYHEPIAMQQQTQLTENALSKLEHGDKIVQGPYYTIESLNASNRLHVSLVLLRVYNQNISIMPQCSRASLCKMCSRLVNQGSAQGSRRMTLDGPLPSSFMPKVYLTSHFLLELLQAIYFSMYNGLPSLGHQALNDVHRRAMQTMYTDVLLVTNAIKNSLQVHPSGHPADGPMGISMAISPTTSTTTVSKAIITNASFRTKKLPDDIPIPKGSETPGQEGLDVIREEVVPHTVEDPSHSTSKEPGPQGAAQAMKAMLPSMRIIPGVSKVVKAITKRETTVTQHVEIPTHPDEELVEMGLAVANPFVDLQTTKREYDAKRGSEMDVKKSETVTPPSSDDVTSKEAATSRKSSSPDEEQRSVVSTQSKHDVASDKVDVVAPTGKGESGAASPSAQEEVSTFAQNLKDNSVGPPKKKTASGTMSRDEPEANVPSKKLSPEGSVTPSVPDSTGKKSKPSSLETKKSDSSARSRASEKKKSDPSSRNASIPDVADGVHTSEKSGQKGIIPNGVEQNEKRSSSVTKETTVNSQPQLPNSEDHASVPEKLSHIEKK